MPDRFRRLPFDFWPAADRELWTRAARLGEPLDDPSPCAAWRPATWRTVSSAYAVALEWLSRQEDPGLHQPPTARWTRERLRAYVADLRAGLRFVTVRHRILNLERALAVLEPEADRSLVRMAIAACPLRTDHTSKRQRLQEPSTLLELGFALMNAADTHRGVGERKNAVRYRIGLQIALLAQVPLRITNFANIRIGHHLVRENDQWLLRFEGAETKNHRPLEAPLPNDLHRALERYVATYRPLLAGRCYLGDRLWLGYRFCPQSAHTLAVSIARVTGETFGRPVNPHLFRDCAATSVALHRPEAVRMVSSLLGHASFGTAERFYNLANSCEAGRDYFRFIQNRRQR
jgi:integrase/recombinase XerD